MIEKIEDPVNRYVKNRYLPDSSVVINGQIIDFIESLPTDEKIEIILSRVVLAEVENRANQDKTTGLIGLDMLNLLKNKIDNDFVQEGKIVDLIPYGVRPSLEQIRLNSGGELDAAIRRDAKDIGATLVTADKIQASMGKFELIPVEFLIAGEKNHIEGKRIQEFFDNKSMSVHLKTDCFPMAKKGKPGHWKLEKIGKSPLSAEDLKAIESNIISEAEKDENSFIEKDLGGVTVVQLGSYRIVICRPPFADSNEITAVRPLVKLNLDYYEKIDPLIKRLDKAEGILVAGSPGAGKSTFISALTDYYLEKQKIIKTLESVRDLQVPKEVSQYGELEGDFEKTADILLLVRPDFTIFDEIRTTDDFKIFSDMRLAGVGMVGVVHASSAIDAIQRFIRRVELGVLPSIVDTVIFIRDGQVVEILKLEITVKVPHGFRDRDLARPVIEISNFVNNKLLFEIYEFGSNTVVTPVKRNGRQSDYQQNSGYRNGNYDGRSRSKGKQKKGKKGDSYDRGYQSKFSLSDYNDSPFEASNTSYDLDDGEDDDVDVGEPVSINSEKIRVHFSVVYGKKSIVLKAGPHFGGFYIDLYSDEDFIASYQINKYGDIRVDKQTHLYRKIDSSLQEGKSIYGIKSAI